MSSSAEDGAKRPKRYVETSAYIGMLRRVVKAAGNRVGDADTEDLRELIGIRDDIEAAIQTAIDGLRRDGYTWESIGAAMGVTRQAALMRWGRRVRQ